MKMYKNLYSGLFYKEGEDGFAVNNDFRDDLGWLPSGFSNEQLKDKDMFIEVEENNETNQD